jgi:hypothetical protein
MIDINLEKQLPVLTMNFAEVKSSLIAGAEKYRGLVVTAESLKDCKAMQGELSSTRIKLDNYRKDVKKEMTKPITEFEDKCKELIALVTEVETPLKAGIEVFNQKVRDEKKIIAENIILTFIEEQGLTEKYAKELTVIDKYMNLTAKESDVTDDVAKRGHLLLQQQQQEIETLQIMKDTIENLNKGIDAKLDIADFQSLIDMNYSAVKIMAEINSRAERIKAQEEKAIAEKAAKAEREVQERIAKAEREAAQKAAAEERAASLERERLAKIESDKKIAEEKKAIQKAIDEAAKAEMIRLANLPKEEKQWVDLGGASVDAEENEQANKLLKAKMEAIQEQSFEDYFQDEEQPLYFIEMRVEATLDDVKKLSQFLKDNSYNYTATKKGLVE